MSGFPATPPRVAFGPEMRNKRAPKRPETDLSADQMNLLFWQLAGASRVCPAAVIVYDGDTPAITYQALSFDPAQELGDISVVKNADGDYSFVFASTYQNQAGVDTSFVPAMAMTEVQDGAVNDSAQVTVIGQTVRVLLRDSAGVLKDGIIQLQVWGN